jgi:hypothetical protein
VIPLRSTHCSILNNSVRLDIKGKLIFELDISGLKDVVAPPGHGVGLVSVLLVHVVVGVVDDPDLLNLEGEGAVDPVHQGDAQSGYLVPRGSPLQVLDVTLVGEVELGEGNLKNKQRLG